MKQLGGLLDASGICGPRPPVRWPYTKVPFGVGICDGSQHPFGPRVAGAALGPFYLPPATPRTLTRATFLVLVEPEENFPGRKI